MAGAGNMMFSNNGLDSAPKPQFNMPNSVPQQQMMNQAPNQAPQMQQGGTIYNMPPSMNPFTMPVNSNPTYQKQQPMPPVPAPNQPSGTPFANNVWPPAPPQNTGGNGWNQNQPLSPQQVANFSTLTNQFGNGLGPNGLPNNTPKNNNFAPQGGVTIDYSKGMAFSNPWPPNMQQPNAMSNAMPNQGMMGYNNANPAMSMRQAMLNEGKNNIPGGMNNSIAPAINAMQNMPSDKHQSAPGYSLFNSSSWTPNLSRQIRGPQNDNVRNSMSSQSLFSVNSPTLKQLLEQQNKLHKDNN